MKLKKFLFIICFLMTILLLSTVSASDNSIADILNVDEESLNPDSDELISVDESQTTKETQEIGSFEDLEKEINNTQDVLVLNKSYSHSGNSTSGILINKTITIDGNGFTLNANNLSRVFNIVADNVVLKNIVFINGKNIAQSNDLINNGGGAIYWQGSNGTLINCAFKDNVAYELIYDPFANSSDVQSMFPLINYNRGGAVAWFGDDGKIIDCEFINNYIDYIALTDLRDNNVGGGTPNYGGALYLRGNNIFMNGCLFVNNSAGYAGAIYLKGNGSLIQNSKFFDNEGIKTIIINGNNNIINSSFIYQNTFDLQGSISPQFLSLPVDNTEGFILNSFLFSSYDITKRPFNFVDDQLINNKFNVSNWSYWFKYYDYSSDVLDMLKINDNITILMDGVIVEPLTLDEVVEYLSNLNISDNKYDSDLNNTFKVLSDLINEADDLLILDQDFIAENDYADGILINKSITIDGQGHTIDGKDISRIFKILADNVVLKNIVFVNGKNIAQSNNLTDNGGGAIYWQGSNGTLINCTFINNTAYSLIFDNSFCNDEICVSSRYASVNYNRGGAIVWYGDNGKIIDCEFINNDADNYISLTDKSVAWNTGAQPNYGGALCLIGNNTYINNCRFVNNSAGYAGAICLTGDGGLIQNSRFFENKGVRTIIINGNNNTVNSSFFYENSFFTGGSIGPQVFYLPVVNSEGHILNSFLFSSNDLMHRGFYDGEQLINNKFNVNKWYYWFKHYDYADDYVYSNDMEYIASVLIEDVIVKPLTLDEVVDYLINLNKSSENSTSEETVLLKIPDSEDLTIYFKDSKEFKVTLYGSDGKVAVNQNVKFIIGKRIVNTKTDENGVAHLKITEKPGEYSVITEFGNIKVKNTVTVKSRLITKNVSKKVKKSASFKVKVLNTKGKAFAKQTVKIKFKGKTYKVKTNSKGIATLKLGKKLKAGKYAIKTYYAGLTNTNKVIVKK